MFSSEAWLANPGANFYNGVATQSLRLDGGTEITLDNAGAATSNKIATISVWFKRADELTTLAYLFHSKNDGSFGDGSNGLASFSITLDAADTISVVQYNGNPSFNANQYDFGVQIQNRKFRDMGSWYHLVVAIDTTQGSGTTNEANRIKIYINGEQQTVVAISDGSGYQDFADENQLVAVNQDGEQRWGGTVDDGTYAHVYLAEINVVDGLQLTPGNFGETKNGVWIAKNPSVSEYGNHGYRLQFKETGVGAGASDTVGADTSGKNNHFTTHSNIAAHDCAMPDSPENNFATLNPVYKTKNNQPTFSEGNLKVTPSQVAYQNTFSTMGVSSGKWYAEILVKGTAVSANYFGIADIAGIDYLQNTSTVIGYSSSSYGIRMLSGAKYNNDSLVSYGSQVTNDQVFNIALDMDNGKVWFGSEGTYFNSGDPAGGSGEAYASLAGTFFIGMTQYTNGFTSSTINFGQDSTFAGDETATSNADANGIGAFHHAPPSGFLAICSANLPEPTIGPNSGANNQSDDHFNTVIYDGTNGEKAISDVGFQPDLVWLKRRNADGHHHMWHDSSRPLYGYIRSSLTNVENTNSGYNWFKSFDTNGFTVSYSSTGGGNTSEYSTSGGTYVAWNWKANGGTTVTNESGSIDSTVQANTTAGFSIVTWTGTGATVTLGHSLGKKPDVMIVKNRDATNSWVVYHSANTSEPATEYLLLNDTAGTADNNTLWNDTEPTDSVFTAYGQGAMNGNTNQMIAYLFTEIEGYSKFGSYTANNSTDGSFVFTNFTPAFVMIKSTSQTESWDMHDNARNPFNVNDKSLIANGSNTENVVVVARQQLDFLSNGFKLRNAGDGNASINNESGTYIYMAFAKNPFKYSTAQ